MRILKIQGMMGRHFKNQLPDYKPGTSITIDKSKFARYTKQTLDRILKDENALQRASVYTGSAGIAYAICHTLRNTEIASHFPDAAQLAKNAVDLSCIALQQHHHHPSGVPWSLAFGEAGAQLVAAFAHHIAANCGVTPNADLQAAAARHVENFIQYGDIAVSAACHEDEFLYGRAGYLMGALYLNNYFSEISPKSSTPPPAVLVPGTLIEALARVLLSSGKRQAAATLPPLDPEYNTPLWWEWHGSPYLGAAHGSMGILYVLLQVPEPLLDAIPHSRELIRGAVEYVMTLECDKLGTRGVHHRRGHFPSRMGAVRDKEPLVHWCHGAPGAVFLFTQAEKVLLKSTDKDGGQRAECNQTGRYLAVAERAGETIWQEGLLKKGPGACHGVSGNSFALLKLYKETKDEKWLYRAVKFAEFMDTQEFLKEASQPDHPNSLFEGTAAAACLYADLIDPRNACFPLFDLPRGRVIDVRSGCNEDLPIELQDLKITDQGLLIDEKTGEVINEYGATRFDIKMAALNGQFQPPPSVQDTERSTGLILDSLMHWPATYDFQFVLKTAQGEATSSPAEILEEMRVLVGRICSKEIEVSVCSVKERKGGKYVSVTVPAVVNGPEVIQRVFDTLEEDASFNGRILMKY
ncbi:putative LanC-like protein 3 [Nannochloris sp. 'desiccata']|nr:putative LanC-like protein 3 [Chlorella desiccata (nom. nud.)]